MNKLFALCFLAVFSVCALLGGIASASINEADFYSPWQFITRAANGTTTTIATIEAFSGQNVIIDRIIAYTDKANANVYIGHLTREATAFNGTFIGDAALGLKGVGSTGSYEVQVLGGDSPMIPLWVGDKGHAVVITAEGTAKVTLLVNGRRGTINPQVPSSGTEKGF